MTGPKKLIVFSVVFFLLLGFSWFISIKGKPTAGNKNPLKKVEETRITKIILESQSGVLAFERDHEPWLILEPIKDVADSAVMGRLVEVLQRFTIGSLISESTNRYDKFGITKEKAIHLQVYLDGTGQPALDGYIGKQGATQEAVYFRFEGGIPVYIAQRLRRYQLERKPEFYRLKDLLSADFPELSRVEIKSGSKHIKLTRSSATWTNEADQKEIAKSWIENLKSRLKLLKAGRFESKETVPPDEFDKPSMEIMLEWPEGQMKAVVGPERPVEKEKKQREYFARTEGREAVLVLREGPVKDLRDHLQTLQP